MVHCMQVLELLSGGAWRIAITRVLCMGCCPVYASLSVCVHAVLSRCCLRVSQQVNQVLCAIVTFLKFSMVDTMTLRQFLDAVPWEAAEPEMVNEIEAVLLNNRITARPLHPARKPALMFLVSGPGAPS